jgi:hypothetical protein
MWRCVVCWDATDISEEHIAFIFTVEENFSKNQQISRDLAGLHGITSQKKILFNPIIVIIQMHFFRGSNGEIRVGWLPDDMSQSEVTKGSAPKGLQGWTTNPDMIHKVFYILELCILWLVIVSHWHIWNNWTRLMEPWRELVRWGIRGWITRQALSMFVILYNIYTYT